MKKIKKLTLNKEVVSIIAANKMNMVKGGTGTTTSAYCNDAIPPTGQPPQLPRILKPSEYGYTCPDELNPCSNTNLGPYPTEAGYFCHTAFQEQSCYPCADHY